MTTTKPQSALSERIRAFWVYVARAATASAAVPATTAVPTAATIPSAASLY